MSSRKRVSFGNKGSMVETWIIEDLSANQRSPTRDVREIESTEFCDSVMPSSRDIVVVTQPVNLHHNNHVVLNDPISIFRSNIQNNTSKISPKSSNQSISSQPVTDKPILNITSSTVNIKPSEILSGNVKTIKVDSKRINMTNVKHTKENTHKQSNGGGDNGCAVIPTTHCNHRGNKRDSMSSAGSGSLSFRTSELCVHTTRKKGSQISVRSSNQEEYYDVLNPQPVGQTSPTSGYYDQDYHDHRAYPDDDGDDNVDDDGEEDEEEKYYWESDPMLSLREEDSSVLYRVDPLTGWPLKRSTSLESRDNPFLPGGDLSKEAEDLLSKATIIRDNFFLKDEEKRELMQHQHEAQEEELHPQQQKQTRSGVKHVQILDHYDGRVYSSADPSSPSQNGGVEERISPQSTSNTFAAPVPSAGGDVNHAGANGKSSDHPNNNTNSSSPDSVKIAIPEGDGQSIPLTGDPLAQGADKKRRNKCCVVM